MTGLRFEEGSVQPRYDSYCLSNIPSTLLSILGVEIGRTKLPNDVFDGVDTTGIENVVLFLLDGLGYKEWQRQVGMGFLGNMGSKGKVTPITSVFPSTTSAALTTLTTALTPQEHSLVEWFLYLKETDMVIQSLPFSPVGTRGADLLLPYLSPDVLVTGKPLFPRLTREGVVVRSYLSRFIANSSYSRLMHGASDVQPYVNAFDMADLLRRKLESERGASFHYVYYSAIDSQEHSYGPGSRESYVEAANVSAALTLGLDKLDERVASKTLFVVTADHGHVRSSTDDSVWLDKHRNLTKSLARSPAGKTIPPWGSPRDIYLRIEEDSVDEVQQYLSETLSGVALVAKSADVVSSGVFGVGTPSATFLERVGNLMVLPKREMSVWYHYPDVESPLLRGQHGGMHVDEMTVPFAVARASALRD